MVETSSWDVRAQVMKFLMDGIRLTAIRNKLASFMEVI